jgi:hypothetical protein
MIKWRTFVVGGLSFLGAGLLGVAAHDWVDAPLWGQPSDGATVYVWPARPPGVALWPAADYPIHCTAGGVRQARDFFSRVTGMVRQNPPSATHLAGSLDVLMEPAVKCVRFGPPPDRQCLEWATDFDRERWEPLGASNQLYANVYYRVGPCWIGGHGHGQDGEVGASEDEWFPRIYGRAPTMMERTDIKYFPMNSPPLGLWWMRAEYNRLEGNPAPTPTATPLPTATPQPTVTPQPTPVPRCVATSRVIFTRACRAATSQVAAGKPVGPKRKAGLLDCEAAHDKLPDDGGVYVPGVLTASRLSLTLDDCQ